jgi:hypothetical protein
MLVRNIFPSHFIYKTWQHNVIVIIIIIIIIIIILYGHENERPTKRDKLIF